MSCLRKFGAFVHSVPFFLTVMAVGFNCNFGHYKYFHQILTTSRGIILIEDGKTSAGVRKS